MKNLQTVSIEKLASLKTTRRAGSIQLYRSMIYPFYCVAWPKKEQTCFVCNLINIGGKSFLLHNEGEMDERERETSLPSDFGLFYFRSRGRGYSLPGFLIHYRLVLLICKSPKGFSLLWFGKQKTVDWNSLVVSWLSSIGFNVILR